MKKSYADICLERANKATEGPWEVVSDLPSWAVASFKGQTDVVSTKNRAYRAPHPNYGCELYDAEFIAHSRTDIVELANRLKRAIAYLRRLEPPRGTADPTVADELERPLVGK